MLYHDASRELEHMSDQLNRLLARRSTALGQDEAMAVAQWVPAIDVVEADSAFQVRADLPGVEKEQVNVSIDKGVLLIAGHREREKEMESQGYHRTECPYGRFARSLRLPDSVDEAKLTAELRSSLLTVHLPKSERARPKSIDIKIA